MIIFCLAIGWINPPVGGTVTGAVFVGAIFAGITKTPPVPLFFGVSFSSAGFV
jgi:hypothetical protein